MNALQRMLRTVIIITTLWWESSKSSTLVYAQTCPADETSADVLGPFYIPGAPITTVLAPPSQVNDPKKRLTVSGTVYGKDCVPMSRALVEPWYAGDGDENGDQYSVASSSLAYRARITTSACGKYSFTGTFPASYPQRPIRHIHFRISYGNNVELLVTQMYFEGYIINGYNPASNQIVPIVTAADGSRSVTFDIEVDVPGTGSLTNCPAGAPTRAPNVVITLCFSGEALVETQDNGIIPMKDLRIGDLVKVDASGKYEPVYSFGHYYSNRSNEKSKGDNKKTKQDYQGDFLVFNRGIEISPAHMIAVEGRGFVPASTVRLGDKLLSGDHEQQQSQKAGDGELLLSSSSSSSSSSFIEVTSISTKKSAHSFGMFAPFTPSGTIVVNGIVASSFISMQQDSAHLMIPGTDISTGLTWHWLAHSFEFPHRVVCYYLGRCPNETYNENGMSWWIAKPHSYIRWLLSSSSSSKSSSSTSFASTIMSMASFTAMMMIRVCFVWLPLLSLMVLFAGLEGLLMTCSSNIGTPSTILWLLIAICVIHRALRCQPQHCNHKIKTC